MNPKCSRCGKEITEAEDYKYSGRCEGCYYEDAQERTINEVNP